MHKRFLVVAVALFATISGLGSPARAQSERTVEPTSNGEVIVGFHRGALPAVAGGGRLDGLPVGRVSEKGSFVTLRAADLGEARRALAARPGVSYVEDNTLLHALLTPNDPRYGSQYGPGLMGFPRAWETAGYGNASVTVAVIDSGVLASHEDLAGPRLLAGRDYVNNDATPEDDCGHGTHVAGTVGATTNNGLGVGGMTQATILPLRALSQQALGKCSGSQAGIAQAIIDAADQGAKVISMSIGGPPSTTMQNAVNHAVGKGAIVVAAAGNDGGSDHVDYPAAYPNVIAVGAITSAKTRASYSDAGPQLDIAAPGSNVLSTYTGSNTSYASASGTSMATPHVAGALALALGCAPAGTTRESIVNALYSTAEDLGTAGFDNQYGHGLARTDRLVAQLCAVAPPPPPPPPPSDPDPSTRTVTSGQNVWFTMNSSNLNRFVKIAVPAGATKLQATAFASNCSGTSCPVNVDVYTRQAARPTNTAFNCRANTVGSMETCTTTSPAPAYWYVRVKWVAGSGSIRLTTTIS